MCVQSKKRSLASGSGSLADNSRERRAYRDGACAPVYKDPHSVQLRIGRILYQHHPFACFVPRCFSFALTFIVIEKGKLA